MLRFVYLLSVLCLGLAGFSEESRALDERDPLYELRQEQWLERFDELIRQSKASMMADPALAYDIAGQAEDIALSFATSKNSPKAVATSLWLQSEALIRTNRVDDVEPLLDRALGAIQGDALKSKLGGDLLLVRGRVSRLTGDVETALNSFHKAHAIFIELEIARSQSIVLQSIGSIYNDARSFERVLEYYGRADEVYSGDPSLDISSANNRANALKELARYDEAIEQFSRALVISSEIDSPLLEARILTNLASLHILTGDLAVAERTADMALERLKDSDGDKWTSFVWGVKAKVDYRRGDVVRARHFISKAFAGIDIAETFSPYRDMHEIAYEIYAETSEHALAFQHLEAFKRLDDHGREVSASANLALIGAQFDFANQNLEIQQLKNERLEKGIELAQARRKQQEFAMAVLLGLSAFVIIWITSAYFSIKARRNEERIANARLRETVDQMNTEIDRRLETERKLRDAKEQAEGANHAKTQFLANMSHELRTPLNAIIGFAEIIGNEILGPNGKPEYKEYANDIHDSGQHLLSILNDILDMARIDAGKVKLVESEFSIHNLIEDSLRLFRDEAQKSGKSLKVILEDPDLTIKADERMMRQILLNLISNAMKFTEPGCQIEIQVETKPDSGVGLVVQDDGVGIPADKIETILEPFGQVEDSYARAQGGTGLGLPIVRSLIELHGGRFTIQSKVGEGTRACAELPIARTVRKAA